MDSAEEIRNLAAACLANEDKFIVDVLVSSRKGPKKVLVVIDGDKGVTIDDCAEVSRKLSKALDDSELIKDQYLLEVSSPGLDHPLTLNRQFRKNIGRKLKIVTDNMTLEGKLEFVDEDSIRIRRSVGKDELSETIPFSAIKKAFVLISLK
ncbi:MAG TPA: ribosome maturation factor RimP [Cyclobacteriaceae bacterium]|nr:ribosome maturation factor RimP [Cyclobacteriaceae bacterium]